MQNIFGGVLEWFCMLTEKNAFANLRFGFLFTLGDPPSPWFGKRPHFFRFFFGPLLLQWDEVKMEGRGEGVWNECDDSWEWIQWKYRCLQTKPRKVHLQLFQIRKKQIDFLFAVLLLFLIVLLYVNSPRGGSQWSTTQDWLDPIDQVYFSSSLQTRYGHKLHGGHWSR